MSSLHRTPRAQKLTARTSPLQGISGRNDWLCSGGGCFLLQLEWLSRTADALTAASCAENPPPNFLCSRSTVPWSARSSAWETRGSASRNRSKQHASHQNTSKVLLCKWQRVLPGTQGWHILSLRGWSVSLSSEAVWPLMLYSGQAHPHKRNDSWCFECAAKAVRARREYSHQAMNQ